jgi:4-amino-4-deoxy-L-arabinose transferase-like glycosyltransferase
LFLQGDDWLDKPRLPFWLSAISFSIFGFSTWA